MRAILIASIFLFLTACATTHTETLSMTPQSWIGKSADSLMEQKGAPGTVMPNGRGNTLLIYTTEVRQNYPTTVTNPTAMPIGKGRTVAANLPQTPSNTASYPVEQCTTTFEVDRQHMIVTASEHGSGCN